MFSLLLFLISVPLPLLLLAHFLVLLLVLTYAADSPLPFDPADPFQYPIFSCVEEIELIRMPV
jgi:hypothetical protein